MAHGVQNDPQHQKESRILERCKETSGLRLNCRNRVDLQRGLSSKTTCQIPARRKCQVNHVENNWSGNPSRCTGSDFDATSGALTA